MEPRRTATWYEWIQAYERVYLALPKSIRIPCPNCGQATLRLQLTGNPETHVGFASFWCTTCMLGISTGRCNIPHGVDMLSFDLPDEEWSRHVPQYKVIPPDLGRRRRSVRGLTS